MYDSATDAIVDYAVATGKPFAIVPCCTFTKQFTKRRTADGGPVESYDQLLDYLLLKDGAVRRSKLDFEGRNTVIWRG